MAKIVINILSTVLSVLAFLVSPLFRLIFERKRGNLPSPKSPLVMKSATELAELIRQREVI